MRKGPSGKSMQRVVKEWSGGLLNGKCSKWAHEFEQSSQSAPTSIELENYDPCPPPPPDTHSPLLLRPNPPLPHL